ncbi:uncharacterized protein ACBT57_013738 isoform 5-T5 [Dama dama]
MMIKSFTDILAAMGYVISTERENFSWKFIMELLGTGLLIMTVFSYCREIHKKLGFNSTWTVNFQMFKLVLEKQRNQRLNCQHRKSKRVLFLLFDYAKVLDCVKHNDLWKILKEMGIPDHLTCLLRNLYAGQKVTELDMEQQTVSK